MRLFTGLALAPAVLQQAERILEELRPTAEVRWAPLSNLHITLAFIGSWDEARLPDLQAALAGVARCEPIAVSITGFGFFPNPHRPHSFFLAVKREPALEGLVSNIEAALVRPGCAREDRPYTPHVTLARIARENITQLRFQIASMNHLFPLETFETNEFHLYESRPGKSGSVYTKLAAFPFGAGAQ